VHYNSSDFSYPQTLVKKLWVRPKLSSAKLTSDEILQAGTTPESIRAFGLRRKVEGRL
jgi:hypothetical protein